MSDRAHSMYIRVLLQYVLLCFIYLSFEIVVLCEAIRFMSHNVGARKVRQITTGIIGYSLIILIKLYM